MTNNTELIAEARKAAKSPNADFFTASRLRFIPGLAEALEATEAELGKVETQLRVDRQLAAELLDELETERDSLYIALGEAERARDLAIAHDTQPYPTAWAYDQACRVMHEAKAERAAAFDAGFTAAFTECTMRSYDPSHAIERHNPYIGKATS